MAESSDVDVYHNSYGLGEALWSALTKSDASNIKSLLRKWNASLYGAVDVPNYQLHILDLDYGLPDPSNGFPHLRGRDQVLLASLRNALDELQQEGIDFVYYLSNLEREIYGDCEYHESGDDQQNRV